MKFLRKTFLQKSVVSLCAATAILFMIGCGEPVQVIVPSDFHGNVVVHCTSTGSQTRPLQANVNGVADGACPSVGTGILIYRAGQQVSVLGLPGWTRDRDGLPKAIRVVID